MIKRTEDKRKEWKMNKGDDDMLMTCRSPIGLSEAPQVSPHQVSRPVMTLNHTSVTHPFI